MQYWTRDEIMAGAELPQILQELVGCAVEAFEERDRLYPRFLRAGANNPENEEHLYELEIELTSGMILPAYCGNAYLEEIGWDDNDVETLLETVMEGVNACLPRCKQLGDVLHEARMRTRRFIAAQNQPGPPMRLVDVTLAPYDSWRGRTDPALLIHLESLGEGLTPARFEIPVEDAENLESELESWQGDFRRRFVALRDVLGHGASGRVSQLALNAIAHHGDVVETLRRFTSESLFWLPDSTAIHFHGGCVIAGNGNLEKAFQWRRDGFRVAEETIAPISLSAAVGKPVTDVIQHPFFSSDMIVTAVETTVLNDCTFLSIGLDIPIRLFCASSGRIWDECIEEGPSDFTSDKVIAFRRRGG